MIYYVCALLIPIFLFVASILIIKENNKNWIRTRIHAWRYRSKKQQHASKSQQDASNQPPANATTDDEEALRREAESSEPPAEQPIPVVYNPYTKTLSLHLHHWQIFFMLAFFTR